MLTSSAKAKGRKLQQIVRDALLKAFPEFTENDVRSTSMGAQGADVLLSEAAVKKLGIQIECKNLAKIAVYKFYEQAKTHGNNHPVVCIKQNKSEPLVLISLDHFVELLRRQHD